jgi:hypothetical protein
LAGETIEGNIFLDLKKTFPGNKISLIIKGSEKCKWSSNRKYESKHVFFD